MPSLRKRNSRNRRLRDNSLIARVSDTAATLSVNTGKLQVSFDQPVVITGTPNITAQGGAHVGIAAPISMQIVNQQTIILTYTAVVAAGNTITILNRDPAVRTATAGYMIAQNKGL